MERTESREKKANGRQGGREKNEERKERDTTVKVKS